MNITKLAKYLQSEYDTPRNTNRYILPYNLKGNVMKQTKRLIALLLVVCLSITCLCACSSTDEGVYSDDTPDMPDSSVSVEGDDTVEEDDWNDVETADVADWTVMLYLCGTDLESQGGAATSNLVELLQVDFVPEVNYVIQTGGTQVWQNTYMTSDCLQRWQVMDHDLVLVDEQPLASMGEASTLGEFLTWGVENYPAEKYMTVLWNHGGGSVSGVEFDELYGNDSLSLTELAEGLSAPGVVFEVIGFDTCLMSTLENAAAIAPFGNYMVASEEYEPGGGWDYYGYMQYICDNPEADGLSVGAAICDSYYAKCELQGTADMATLAVTDLNQVDTLVSAFNNMAAEMSGVTEDMDSFRTFIQGVTRTENYGGNTAEEGYTNMVDLGHLVMNTQDVLPQTADDVLTALFNTVLYSVQGASRTEANGLSVFFPLGYTEEILDSFAYITPSSQYVRFVETATGWEAPAETLPTEETEYDSVVMRQDEYAIELSTYLNEDNVYHLSVDNGLDAINSVQFALYYLDYDSSEYMLMGYDNNIVADWESGIFHDNFWGEWMAINGYYCAPNLITEEADYNIYSIPILLNGEPTNLRATYIWDSDESGHYEIHGAWDGIDPETGMSAKEIRQIQPGDEITPLFDIINWNTGESATYAMGSFIVEDELILEDVPLFDGEYLYQFLITDVFGNQFWSDTVIMECADGEIYVYEE